MENGVLSSETDISREIQKALAVLGVWVIRTQVKGRRGRRSVATGEPGMPDLCLPAFGWLEIKAAKGKLSPEQTAWHRRAAAVGVRVEVVRSVGEAVAVVRAWQDELNHSRAMGWDT